MNASLVSCRTAQYLNIVVAVTTFAVCPTAHQAMSDEVVPFVDFIQSDSSGEYAISVSRTGTPPFVDPYGEVRVSVYRLNKRIATNSVYYGWTDEVPSVEDGCYRFIPRSAPELLLTSQMPTLVGTYTRAVPPQDALIGVKCNRLILISEYASMRDTTNNQETIDVLSFDGREAKSYSMRSIVGEPSVADLETSPRDWLPWYDYVWLNDDTREVVFIILGGPEEIRPVANDGKAVHTRIRVLNIATGVVSTGNEMHVRAALDLSDDKAVGQAIYTCINLELHSAVGRLSELSKKSSSSYISALAAWGVHVLNQQSGNQLGPAVRVP